MRITHLNTKGKQYFQIDSDHYCHINDIDLSSGEIIGEVKEFNKTINRAENKKGLARSMKNLRDIINCNVTEPKNCRWVTLTYAENMTDTKRLYIDCDKFYKRLKYFNSKNNYGEMRYITIAEPQGRGAWHLHCIWIYDHTAPFIPNEVVAKMWGFGFVTIKKLDNVDNVGAYLTAYLCDCPIEEFVPQNENDLIFNHEIKEVEIENEDGTKSIKKFVKGARLHMYPNKMNFYRTSRNIKRPTVEWVKENAIKEKISGATLTFSKTVRLSDSGSDFSNDIQYEYYNQVRKICQEDKNNSK